jgi:hypothetical protein
MSARDDRDVGRFGYPKELFCRGCAMLLLEKVTSMNIDERLQALTETVGILAGMQRENEKRFGQITHNFEMVLDSIKRLENIAVAHDHRLDDLEGQ